MNNQRWGVGTLMTDSHLTDDLMRTIFAIHTHWRRKLRRAVLKIKFLLRFRDGGWMNHNNRRWEVDSNKETKNFAQTELLRAPKFLCRHIYYIDLKCELTVYGVVVGYTMRGYSRKSGCYYFLELSYNRYSKVQ